jgi:hypothetical protein
MSVHRMMVDQYPAWAEGGRAVLGLLMGRGSRKDEGRRYVALITAIHRHQAGCQVLPDG